MSSISKGISKQELGYLLISNECREIRSIFLAKMLLELSILISTRLMLGTGNWILYWPMNVSSTKGGGESRLFPASECSITKTKSISKVGSCVKAIRVVPPLFEIGFWSPTLIQVLLIVIKSSGESFLFFTWWMVTLKSLFSSIFEQRTWNSSQTCSSNILELSWWLVKILGFWLLRECCERLSLTGCTVSDFWEIEKSIDFCLACSCKLREMSCFVFGCLLFNICNLTSRKFLYLGYSFH